MPQPPIQSWTEVGRRVADAREAANLSRAELATALDVALDDVVELEEGQASVTPATLQRLSNILDRPIHWFTTTPLPSIVSLRAGRAAAQQDLRALAILEDLATDVELLHELGVLPPPAARLEVRMPTTPQEAEAAAHKVRQHLGLGADPVFDLPRPLERLGLFLFCLALGRDRLDGASVALQVGGVALVNGTPDVGRRRFTAAHELGHHLFEDEYSLDWRIESDSEATERLISAFAIHFLMPGPSIRRRWSELDGATNPRTAAIHLAAEYGVSWSATCAQLVHLGLLDQTGHDLLVDDPPRHADYLEQQVSIRHDLVPPSVPPGYASAVIKAFKGSNISRERALDLLRGTLAPNELPEPSEIPLPALLS